MYPALARVLSAFVALQIEICRKTDFRAKPLPGKCVLLYGVWTGFERAHLRMSGAWTHVQYWLDPEHREAKRLGNGNGFGLGWGGAGVPCVYWWDCVPREAKNNVFRQNCSSPQYVCCSQLVAIFLSHSKDISI